MKGSGRLCHFNGCGAAPPSPESNEGELGKQGGNNPGADTNPREDQEDTVERVGVS